MVTDSTDEKGKASTQKGGDVAYTMPDAVMHEAAYAARQLYDAGATSPDSSEMHILLRKQREAKELSDAKEAMIQEIDAVIARTPEGEEKRNLRELRERVETVRSRGALTAIEGDVRSATTAAVNAAGGDKGDDKVVDINSMHKELYARDAVYRKKSDEIDAKAKSEQAKLAIAQTPIDDLAKQYNITTTADAELKKISERIDAEKAGENDLKLIRQLEAQKADLLLAQNKERIAKAPNAEVADTFRKHQEVLNTNKENALANLKKQLEAYEKAMWELLTAKSKGTLSENDIAEFNALKKANQQTLQNLSESKVSDIIQVSNKRKQETDDLKEAVKTMLAENVSTTEAVTSTPSATPIKPKESKQQAANQSFM